MYSSLAVKFLRCAFWFVMCTRFPETMDTRISSPLSQRSKLQLSEVYVKLVETSAVVLQSEALPIIIFSTAYLLHYIFYKYFPPQRSLFDARFILFCYKTLLAELSGPALATDEYVRMMIDRLFTAKFKEYQTHNVKELLLKEIELKKAAKKDFLGFPLHLPVLPEPSQAADFKHQVQVKFKKDKQPINQEKLSKK